MHDVEITVEYLNYNCEVEVARLHLQETFLGCLVGPVKKNLHFPYANMKCFVFTVVKLE
jgi:hypothetical protein